MIDIMINALKSAKEIAIKRPKETTNKGYADFVTDIDVMVQTHITKVLHNAFPDIPLVSEENDVLMSNHSKVFILDPIDGTTNIRFDLKTSVISLAYMEDNMIKRAVVYDPFREEIFHAEYKKGAYLNQEKISVNAKESLKDCLIAIGTSPYHRKALNQRFKVFQTIFEQSLDIRRTGSAALDLCYTAIGRFDGFIEHYLKVWDYAAGMLIVREAGGCVQNFQGVDVSLENESSVVSGNKDICKKLQTITGDLCD